MAATESKAVQMATLQSLGTDEARRLRRAEILLDLYHRTAGLKSLDEILETVIGIASNLTHAERGTLFLHDSHTNELYSRIAQGNLNRDLRTGIDRGVAGQVFKTGEGVIVADAYSDPHFDTTMDTRTGFTTRNILCAPIRTVLGEVIGVVQMLNKMDGNFNADDLSLLEAMGTQVSAVLQGTQVIERMDRTRAQELRFLEVVCEVTSEIDIETLLTKVMVEATRMLNAERSTIFLNDEKTNELRSMVSSGPNDAVIRFPNNKGIAGTVFTSGKSVEIPYAYADLRFNPTFDRQTGFFTRNILCVPIINKNGKAIGVTQVLNKRSGPFVPEDESRLRAFTAQVSIALENASLFSDVQNIKKYNESMLESMSTGVITLDEDSRIVTCNAAGLKILQVTAAQILNKMGSEFFKDANAWVMDVVQSVSESRRKRELMDADYKTAERNLSVNVTALPLRSDQDHELGTLLMFEDISEDKRMKSTMLRHIDPSVYDQISKDGGDILGGTSGNATIFFSDIRSFTTLTEELGAQKTVTFLNEYFTIMMESIQREAGMLDKFIGDAIMAAFGMPVAQPDHADRAVRAAISMLRDLNEWNLKRKANGLQPVDIGIGINTDAVMAGNIGSPKRMAYTLIGDGVNLASRLESACKAYSAKILVSEFTLNKLKGNYRTREVDRVLVKGKTKPVGIHEVLEHHTPESFPNMFELLHQFRAGIAFYREQSWSLAISAFQAALDLNPQDHLSRIYMERCQIYQAKPPTEDWDGTWVMTTK